MPRETYGDGLFLDLTPDEHGRLRKVREEKWSGARIDGDMPVERVLGFIHRNPWQNLRQIVKSCSFIDGQAEIEGYVKELHQCGLIRIQGAERRYAVNRGKVRKCVHTSGLKDYRKRKRELRGER